MMREEVGTLRTVSLDKLKTPTVQTVGVFC